MAAVAKLLCDLAKGGGGAAEVRWRWMRAVRLMGVVAEGRGRWEKRAADLEEQEQIKVSKLSVVTRRRANVSYSPMKQFRPGAVRT